MLRQLYEELYGSIDKPGKLANLSEMALRLSELAGREKPWTAKYLNSLINQNGNFRVTEELQIALNALAGQLDNEPPLKAFVKKIKAFGLNGDVREGSIVTGTSKRCKGCFVLFVGKVPWQKYCCRDCRKKKSITRIK